MAKRRTLTFVVFLVFALSICLFTASFATAKQALAEEQWTTTDWVLSEEDGEQVYTATGDKTVAHDLTLNSIGENNKFTFDFRINDCTGERYAYFNYATADNQVLSVYLRPSDECMYIFLNGNRLAGENYPQNVVAADNWNTVTIELHDTYATFVYAGQTATGVYGKEIDFTNASLTFTTDRILPSMKNFKMEKIGAVVPDEPDNDFTMEGWEFVAEANEYVYNATGDRADNHVLTLNSLGEYNQIKFSVRKGDLTGERSLQLTVTAGDNVLDYVMSFYYEEMFVSYNGTQVASSKFDSVSAAGWNEVTLEWTAEYALISFTGRTARYNAALADFKDAQLTVKANKFLPSVKGFTYDKVAVEEKPETDFVMEGWDITKQGDDILYYTTGAQNDTHKMTLESVGENNKLTFLVSRGNCTGERYINFILTSTDGQTLKMSFRFDANAVYIHYNGIRLDGQNHDDVSAGGFNQATMEFYKGHAVFSFVDVTMNKTYKLADNSLTLADFTNAKLTIEADRILPSIKNIALEKVTEEAGDKTELNKLIATVDALEESKYTNATYAALATPLANAKTLGENATQDEVDYAYQELNVAYSALVEKADMTNLSELIATVEALNANDYTNATYAALATPLANAKALTAENAQADVDAAYDALKAAYDALVRKADLTQLNALIATVEELNAADYTNVTYAALATPLATAKALTAEDAQADVDAAYDALKAAYDALVRKVDLTQLNALIATVEALEEDKYTAESYAALKSALDSAKALTAEDAQADVDAAYTALNTAYEALEEKQAPDTDSSTDSGSASDSGATTDSGSQTEEKTGCFGGIETTSVMFFMLGMVAVYAIIKRRKANA